MRYVWTAIILVLVFLAVSSGLTKILLMQQDVEFFNRYGFNNPMMQLFGVTQLLGGVLLIFARFRIAGAAIIFITFLISLVMLLMDGNIPFSIPTIVALVALVAVILRTRKSMSAQKHTKTENKNG